MHRQIVLQAADRSRNQLRIRDFHNNALQSGVSEHLLLGHSSQPLEMLHSVRKFRRRRRAVIDHSDDFIDVGHLPQGDDLSRRMFMRNTDLCNFDPLHFHLLPVSQNIVSSQTRFRAADSSP